MPSGTDLVTWSPRVGASGNDRYDPGDGPIFAGNSAGYSSQPTLAEVNAEAHINQIRAEINRRLWDNASYYLPSDPGARLTYVSSGQKIKRSDFTEMKTKIDSIRSFENQSAYSWSDYDSLLVGRKIQRAHIAEFRKALAYDRIVVPPYKEDNKVSGSYYKGLKNTAGTVVLSDDSIAIGYANLSGSAANGSRYRTYIFYRLPSGYPSLGDAKMTLRGQDTNLDNTDYVRVYRTNSHLGPIDTGDWGNLDNLELDLLVSTYFPSGGAGVDTVVADVAHSPLTAGSNITYIFCTKNEETAYPGDPLPGSTLKYGGVPYNVSGPPYQIYILELYTA